MAELLFDEEAHRYTVNGKIIPSVTQIISAVGLYEYDHVPAETLAVAAERGRIVHTYIEWYEQGVLDENSIDPELGGYFEAYLRLKSSGKLPETPSLIEWRGFSEKYGYAGTLDQMYFDDWINDHKTCEPSPVHGLQVSAYWILRHPNIAEKPRKLTCDYLTKEGDFELVEYPFEPLPWLSVLADYKWRERNNCIKPRWQSA